MAADSNSKVVYDQADVFVHTSVPASTLYDNIIRGRVQVIEKPDGAYIDWRPTDLLPHVDFEVKHYSSGNHEYGFVDTKQTSEGNELSKGSTDAESDSYAIHFPASEIQSVRRSDPKLAWSYIVFILKDGSTQPGLHFHNGGIAELIRRLQRYVWLIKSSTNPKVYIAESSAHPTTATLEHLHVLNEVTPDNLSKFLNTAYYGTMIGFAKVSQYVLGNVGVHGSLLERRPRSSSPKSSASASTVSSFDVPMTESKHKRMLEGGDQDFEILSQPPKLATYVSVELEVPLQPEEWCSFMDENGVIQNVEVLKERILKGGVHTDIRREVWKYLLGMYAYDSTYEERQNTRQRQCEEYESMTIQWQTISEDQEKRFTEFSQRKQLAYKDAIRTDRDIEFYRGSDNENVQRLYRILMTYCMYNFDLGYVQGMSDLLSPVLVLMEDEVDAFWCFAGLMQREERNFEMVQQYMKTQLGYLYELLAFLYPKFTRYLESKECDNLYFCFKWLLINFKREFSFSDIMTIWEVSWVQEYTPHFKLFICIAILEENMEYMMDNDYGFNDILKHINSISMKLEVGYVLKRALALISQLQATEDLPQHIHQIIFFPERLKEIQSRVKDDEPTSDKKTLDVESAEQQSRSPSGAITPTRSSGSALPAVGETVELKTDSNVVV